MRPTGILWLCKARTLPVTQVGVLLTHQHINTHPCLQGADRHEVQREDDVHAWAQRLSRRCWRRRRERWWRTPAASDWDRKRLRRPSDLVDPDKADAAFVACLLNLLRKAR